MAAIPAYEREALAAFRSEGPQEQERQQQLKKAISASSQVSTL